MIGMMRMKRVILVLIGLIFLISCAGDGIKLKKENLKLQEENLVLQEQNLMLKKLIHELQAKNELIGTNLFLIKLRNAIAIYYGATDGKWAPSLEALVPTYIDYIPEGDWEYDPKTGKVISKSHPSW